MNNLLISLCGPLLMFIGIAFNPVLIGGPNDVQCQIRLDAEGRATICSGTCPSAGCDSKSISTHTREDGRVFAFCHCDETGLPPTCCHTEYEIDPVTFCAISGPLAVGGCAGSDPNCEPGSCTYLPLEGASRCKMIEV